MLSKDEDVEDEKIPEKAYSRFVSPIYGKVESALMRHTRHLSSALSSMISIAKNASIGDLNHSLRDLNAKDSNLNGSQLDIRQLSRKMSKSK
jgi:hypothetical protein